MFWNKKKSLIDSVLKERPSEWKAPERTVHVPIEVDDPVLPVAMEPEFEDGTRPAHGTPDHLPQLTPKHVSISSVTDLAPNSTMLEEKVLGTALETPTEPSTPPTPPTPPTPTPSDIGAPRRFL